jgi:hypothetical protein
MKKILNWVIIILVLIIVATIGKSIRQSHKEQRSISNPFPVTSPLHEPYKNFAEKLFAIPEVEQHFKNTSSKKEAFAIGMRLSQKGMHRLDDISLENRMRIVGMLFEKVDFETCAVMVRGNRLQYQEFQKKFQQQFLSALEQLGAVTANEWFDSTIKAIVAEARGYPAPVTIDKQKIITSMNNLLRRLSPADADKLTNILTNLNSCSDQDVCWAGKILYREALKMDAANKSVLARAFVSE